MPRAAPGSRTRGSRVWLAIEVALGLVAVLALWRLGDALPSLAGHGGGRDVSTPYVPYARAVTAQTHRYALPRADAGPSLLALDAQGNLWFGEIKGNRLARLDPRTGVFRAWTPPGGTNNLYTTWPDGDGNIWFTEQGANYIGRFIPATEQFVTYPLPTPGGPQDLVLDARGQVYFTLVNSGRIGRLEPATGAVTTWAVAPLPGQRHAMPFSLTLAPDGTLWFGELSGGAVGSFDPATQRIRTYPLRDPQAQVFSMAADSRGRIWFTELQTGLIGSIDTRTGAIREIAVPRLLGDPSSLYSLRVAPDGAVWFISSGANAVVRFTPDVAPNGAFTFYALPQPQSIPYGLALAPDGTLYISADGQPNYIGAIAPTVPNS